MKARMIALLTAPILICGCTQLNVQKLSGDDAKDSTTKGIRYSLPKTFLSLGPGQNGVMQVEEVYLPDHANE